MEETDVIIVGSGPTGLTLALELATQGVSFRLIDKAPQPSDKSKALAMQPRSLELLNRHGLGAELIAAGNLGSGATMVVNGKQVGDISINNVVSRVKDSAFPRQLIISQSDTEHVLIDQLSKYGFAVERGLTVGEIKQQPEGVTAVLEAASGEKTPIRAKYIVGADGAHSAVRHASEVMTFDGAAYPQDFILCDARVKSDWNSNRFYICFGKGLMVLFPLKGGMVRIVASRAGHPEDTQPELKDFQDYMNIMLPGYGELYEPHWMTRYRLHHRGVNTYRDGRLFVAGDAAHIHSPAGGQGMNTGIQDAINLGWKLGSVLRGERPDSFLDSYNDERHPIGKQLLDTTDRAFTWMTWTNPIFMFIRNTLLPWIIPAIATNADRQSKAFRFISELGIHYQRSSVVATAAGFSGPVLGGDRTPDGKVEVKGNSETKYLSEYLAGDRHNLVLFSGIGVTAATREQLDAAQAKFQEAKPKGSRVSVHIVHGSQSETTEKGEGEYRDVNDELHGRYGFTKPGYVYMRPDGYIAHIGNLTSLDELVSCLSLN